MGSRPSVPSAALQVDCQSPSATTALVTAAVPSCTSAAAISAAAAAAAASIALSSTSSDSPTSSESASLPPPCAPSSSPPQSMSASDMAAAAKRAVASSASPDTLPSPHSVRLPAAAAVPSALSELDIDDLPGSDGTGSGGAGAVGGAGRTSGSDVTPPSASSSVSLMSASSPFHRSVFAALPPIVSPGSASIPISFSPVMHSDRSLSINMRRGSSKQSQSPLSPPAVRVLQPASSHPPPAASHQPVLSPALQFAHSFGSAPSAASQSSSNASTSLASFPSSHSPLSPALSSPTTGPTSFPSLHSSVSVSASPVSSVAHPSTVLATFAAPELHLAPIVASKERSSAVSGGASRLIPRLFTSGRRKADKSAAENSPQAARAHSQPITAVDGAAASEQAKQSEETKELSRGDKSGLVSPVHAVRGKVKGNSIAPQPIQPQSRQVASDAGSTAVLEWRDGSLTALSVTHSSQAATADPLSPPRAAFQTALPLSPIAASPASSPSSPTDSLPALRSPLTAGDAHASHLPGHLKLASGDSPTSASSLPVILSTPTVHHTMPVPTSARPAPPTLLASSSSGSAAERTSSLAVPSPVSQSSPHSSSASPTLSASNNSKSHRTSIAQYIDYERRHAAEAQYHLHRKRQHQLKLQQSKQSGDAPDELQSLSVVYLPRGGIYVHTPAGPVQFGMPPETIKDSMTQGLTLPAFFVVPKERFNLQAGINVAEFEFPAYYNFFFKRRRINLITTRSVEPLIRTIFRETLLGPANVDWPAEYGESVPKRCYPDLKKEMESFSTNPFDKTPLTVDSLLAFTHFDDSGRVQLEHGVAIQDADEEYVVTVELKQEDGSVVEREIARVRQEVFSTPLLDDRDKDRAAAAAAQQHAGGAGSAAGSKAEADSVEYFVPPQFGLTMLGNSDGFDSTGTTTGFVLWMNRRGIMVDPPPHSGALLKRHGISARLMRGVILTHNHADHDAGTFQKILEEGKVVLMTTEVILDSFIRKYSAISGLDAQFLRKLFVFRPMLVGQRTAVYGGHVEFFYSLHSIPCVGFAAYCNNRSFVYSADSFNDPAGIRLLHEKGYMSEGRRDALINFPWHHDLILHEAGVPPIHTPLATLEALPDDVKRRLYIVHKPSKDVPTDKGLKSALVGPQNTLIISTDVPPNGRALEVLDLLSGIELFSGFDLSRALEILQCASFVTCSAGDTLIAEGTYGNSGGPPCMYVIAMGTVAVEQDGQRIKQLTVGDHFGEMSIITGEKRTASVRALTPVEVIQFSKQEFLYIVRHTDAVSRLQQLGVIQRSPSWQAISANSALNRLSSAQKTYLQTLLVHRLVAKGDTVWQASDPATEAVLIADGQFYFSRAKDQPPFTRGALVGEMRALIGASTLSTTLQCAEAGSVFAITRPQLCKFFDDNPGVQILFMNRRFIE